MIGEKTGMFRHVSDDSGMINNDERVYYSTESVPEMEQNGTFFCRPVFRVEFIEPPVLREILPK